MANIKIFSKIILSCSLFVHISYWGYFLILWPNGYIILIESIKILYPSFQSFLVMIGNCELLIKYSCFTKCDALRHRLLIRICPLIFTLDICGLYLEM